MRLLIAGGGTGGHIYPALAVARSLRARPGAPELGWLGGHRGLERDIVPPAGIPLRRLLLRSLRSAGRDIHLVLDPVRLALSVPQALVLLIARRPAAIFTTGGYVAIPVLARGRGPAHPERPVGRQRRPGPERPPRRAARHRRRGQPRRRPATALGAPAHLRDGHADPLPRGRRRRRGARAVRRPARRADPARVRRVAGRAPDQRRRAAARCRGSWSGSGSSTSPATTATRPRSPPARRCPAELRDRYRPTPFLQATT